MATRSPSVAARRAASTIEAAYTSQAACCRWRVALVMVMVLMMHALESTERVQRARRRAGRFTLAVIGPLRSITTPVEFVLATKIVIPAKTVIPAKAVIAATVVITANVVVPAELSSRRRPGSTVAWVGTSRARSSASRRRARRCPAAVLVEALCRSTRARYGTQRWPRQSRVRPGRSASLVRSVLRPTALRCSVLRPRRGTRCVRCALCAQTTATSQLTSRAAREAASPVLLGAPEARCVLGARAFAGRFAAFGRPESGPRNTDPGTRKTKSAASRQPLPGGGDLWGAEEASPGHKQSSGLFVPGERPGHWPGAACKASPGVGARSALRHHSHRGCPSAESAANAASSAMRPLGEHRRAVDAFSGDRPSVSPRRAVAGATRGSRDPGTTSDDPRNRGSRPAPG